MCGLSCEDAWDATPAELHICIEAWYKAQAFSAWISGQYVAVAIGTAFSRNVKYPENPLDAFENMVDPDMEVTEEQAEYYRKLIMGSYARLGKPNEDE